MEETAGHGQVGKPGRKRARLRLAEVISETASTRTFRLVAGEDPVPDFRPGQYFSVVARLPHVITSRAYSVCSAPGIGWLDLTVRLAPAGLVTRFLFADVSPGAPFEVDGPSGCLVGDPLAPLLVLLAGGTGVAPFLSIVRDRAGRAVGPRVVLLHNNRDREDMVFATELLRLSASHPWFFYVPVLSGPEPGWEGARGQLTSDRIRNAVGDLKDAFCLVAGPEEMVEYGLDQLLALDVPRNRICRDATRAASVVTHEPGWPAHVRAEDGFRARVEGHGDVEVRADKPLRDALAGMGLEGAAACLGGECGRCRVRVVGGTAFAPPSARVLAADSDGALLHACGAYPLSDVVLRV